MRAKEREVATSNQMSLPLDPEVGDFGSQPVLMLYKFFALSASEQEFEHIVDSPLGGGTVRIKTERSEKYGVATKTDQDFLMFVITKMSKLKTVNGVPRRIKIPVTEYLKASNINSSGHAYQQVRDALNRLQTTRVYTNIELGKQGVDKWFSWVQNFDIHYSKEDKFGEERRRMISVTVEPASWIADALDKNNDLVGYSRGYFELKSPIMQRIYEIISCDNSNDVFKIHVNKLLDLIGYETDTKTFKKNLKRALSVDSKTGRIGSPIPDHAAYPYSATSPHKSCDWGKRVVQKDQYFVFARGRKQERELNTHLDSIPEYQPTMGIHEIGAISSVLEEEAVM